jgi:hypothetical protein
MSGSVRDVVEYMEVVVRSMRKPLVLILVAGAATLGMGATVVLWASQQNPYQEAQSATSGSSLTIEQLGDALNGVHKNTINENGQIYYSVNASIGNTKIEVDISLSPNGKIIWISSDVTAMPANGRTSAAAMLNLLKKNNEIGPMFFSVNGNRLRLSYPIANYNQTADSITAHLQKMADTAMANETLWNPATLAGR